MSKQQELYDRALALYDKQIKNNSSDFFTPIYAWNGREAWTYKSNDYVAIHISFGDSTRVELDLFGVPDEGTQVEFMDKILSAAEIITDLGEVQK